jgi:type VI secretion system protein ImpM
MASEPDLIPGWYGKLPSLGDFASRRLTQQFVATWDTWLQHAMTASRASLGPSWLEVYMNSPIWRFVLLPGVIGDTLWGGIMMPSVDKVGRHFPLTIAVAIADRPGCMAALMGARDWYGDLEETALATLSIDFSVQQFEEHLVSMPFPEVTAAAANNARVAALAAWWQSPSGLFEMPTPAGCDMQQLMQAAATQLFQSAGAGKTLWWREADTSGPIQLACFSALPHPEHFSALLKSNGPGANPVTAAGNDSADAPQLRLV